MGATDDRVVGLLGLGLPVSSGGYDYTFLRGLTKPVLIVQGEDDEFGSGAEVATMIDSLGGPLTLVRIPGSDHYFTDRLDELRDAVRGYYESGPGAALLVTV